MTSASEIDEYDYPTAAGLLKVSESFLRENISKLPHYKKSFSMIGKGAVTFSDAHIAQIRGMFEHQPDPDARLRPSTRRRAS